MSLTIQLFRVISPGTPAKILDIVLPLINKMMIEEEISKSAKRTAVLFSQLIVECESFTRLEEGLNYKPEVLLAQWKNHFTYEQAQKYGRTTRHSADIHMIANLAYGDRMGNRGVDTNDGWRYRGSGWAMTTGRNGFAQAEKVSGKPLLEHPELLRTNEVSAIVAGAEWRTRDMDSYADQGDIDGASRRWNGGDIGLQDRRDHYQRILSILQ
jgi:putative chitinase